LIQKFGNLFRFDGRAIVEDKVVIKGELSIAIVKTTKSPLPPLTPLSPPPLIPPLVRGDTEGFKGG
jgi:hypothetical protein